LKRIIEDYTRINQDKYNCNTLRELLKIIQQYTQYMIIIILEEE